MTETPSTASKTLKIVLWIVLGGAGLCAVCCGAVFLFSKDAREAVNVGMRQWKYLSAIHTRYGAGAQISFTVRKDESGQRAIMAVGIPNFDPAKAAEEQDALWKLFAESFKDGALPVTHLAVGVPAAGSTNVSWEPEHLVPVEDLVRRTGIAAPPTVVFEDETPKLEEGPPPPEAPK